MAEIAIRHWIGGDEEGDPVAESLDPATGERVGCFAEGGEVTARAAVGAARRAFDRTDWQAAPRLRQRVLLRWAAALEAQADGLAILLTRENGKAIAQSRGEIAGAISEILYYAGLARHIPGHVLEPEPGVLSTVLREPAGVVFEIATRGPASTPRSAPPASPGNPAPRLLTLRTVASWQVRIEEGGHD